MTAKQKIEIRLSEVRSRLNEVAGIEGDAFTDEIRSEADALQNEYRDLEVRHRAAIVAETAVLDDAERRHGAAGGGVADGEGAEFRALAGRVSVGRYVENTMGAFRSASARGLNLTGGAELEFNQAVGLGPDQFPLRLLAGPEPEVRATTSTDTTTKPKRWVDRLFADTAAEHLGIMLESVESGVASFPLTTGGGTPAQRGREQAAAAAAWTISATTFDPTRMSVYYEFANEDAMRVPGLEDSIVRDARKSLRERMDIHRFQRRRHGESE